MGDFSTLGGGTDCLESGFVLANTTGTVVTAGAANVKGSYVELLSAANNNDSSDFLVLYIFTPVSNGGAFPILVDIGLGATPSAVIENLYAISTNSSNGSNLACYALPYKIAAGEKISARIQAGAGSLTCSIHLVRDRKSMGETPGLGRVTTIGAATASSSGVLIAGNSTVGTFGSYVQMIASTVNPIKGFIVAAIRGTGSWTNGSKIGYQVAVGASSSEEIIFSGGFTSAESTEMGAGIISPFLPISIAAGQRIAIRAVKNINGTDLDLDYVFYGVD